MATLYERMKAAWDSGNPNALDHEAEDMARHGVAETDIYAALEELLLTLRAANTSEETEDHINDVMDRLTGWCHPSGRIRAVRDSLPTEEEIAKLPHWARVAFAARCARRALPLYGRYVWPEPPNDQIQLLKMAVRGAEIGIDEEKVGGLLNALDLIHGTTLNSALTAHSPALYATQVVRCVSIALQLRQGGKDTQLSEQTRFAFEATDAATRAGEEARLATVIRRDFDHIASLAEWQHWTDDTPVPPEVFGPLWPEGPPKGWPPSTDVPQRTDLAIEGFARERVTEQMIEDDIVNLFNALNRYHIARSGVRLTLEQFRSLLPAPVPVEV